MSSHLSTTIAITINGGAVSSNRRDGVLAVPGSRIPSHTLEERGPEIEPDGFMERRVVAHALAQYRAVAGTNPVPSMDRDIVDFLTGG